MKIALFVLGWCWTILGIWWFFRPAALRKRFEKRFHRGARWLLLAVLFASAGILFAAGRQLGGIWGTLLAVMGVIAVLKALLFVRAKASDTILDWWGQQPVWVYRVSAAGLFLLGCLMQVLLRVGSAGQ